jgi:predicted AAA+ superfamily ATPase
MNYLKRHIAPLLRSRLRQDRMLVLTGSRQVGKTTFCERQLPPELDVPYTYISFDDPDERNRFQKAAVSILESLTAPLVILDEVQKIPALFDPLKFVTDGQRRRGDEAAPLFVLTGSSQLLLMKNIRETLAGRVALCHLYPFSLAEVAECTAPPLLTRIWQTRAVSDDMIKRFHALSPEKARRLQGLRDRHLAWGGYPAVWQREDTSARLNWLKDYRKTYLERDVAEVGQVADIDRFAMAQKLLCARSANLLSLSEAARDLALSVNTVKRYLHLLVMTFQCFLLQPYYENVGKRLIKSPKVYFADTGLMRAILGDLSISGGAMYENWVFNELTKWKQLQPVEPELFFYRTAAGREIDFLLAGEGGLLPIEVKSHDRVSAADGQNLGAFLKERASIPLGLVIYPGREFVEIRPRIWALPDWYLFGEGG